MSRFFVLLPVLFCLSCQPSAHYGRLAPESPTTTTVPGQIRGSAAQRMDTFVKQWLHVPYLHGGESKNGVDCSGFSRRLLQEVYGIHIPRQAQEQYIQGEKISVSRLRAGDLVFFSEDRGQVIDHVGVYMGEGRFVHASVSEGVIISQLKEEYYYARFSGACRYR
jgi:cell wall-associated NlpC family hydrolase